MSTVTHFDILPDVVTPGTYGDSTRTAQITVNAKGIVTAAANVTLAAAGVNDLDSVIRARALTLLGGDFTYWSDPFITIAGRPGSLWTPFHPNSTGVHPPYPDEPAGIQAIGIGSWREMVVDPYYAAPYWGETDPKPSFIGQAADNVPFYMFARVRLNEEVLPYVGYSPDQTVVVGLVDVGYRAMAGIGYTMESGQFRAIGGTAGTPGTNAFGVPLSPLVPVDYDWHDYQMTRTNDGKWWGRIDDGDWTEFTSKIVTGTYGFTGGMPFVGTYTTYDTSALEPMALIDHYAIAVGNPNRPTIGTDIPIPA